MSLPQFLQEAGGARFYLFLGTYYGYRIRLLEG